MTAYCLLLTSWLSKLFDKEYVPLKLLVVSEKLWTVKVFEKSYFSKRYNCKSKIPFLSLKSILSSALTSLTKFQQYLFLKTSISESIDGNLIYAISRNTKVAIHIAVDPNYHIYHRKPGNIPMH